MASPAAWPLGLASGLQQVGIQYTTVGKAGFITALYIVIVPILGLFFLEKSGGQAVGQRGDCHFRPVPSVYERLPPLGVGGLSGPPVRGVFLGAYHGD